MKDGRNDMGKKPNVVVLELNNRKGGNLILSYNSSKGKREYVGIIEVSIP